MSFSDLLADTTNYLHLNATFTDRLGLLDGKSAFALFLNNLGDEYYNQDVFISFVEDILDQISVETSLSFGSGLCGVGIVLENAVRTGTLDADLSIVLAEVDSKIMSSIHEGSIDNIFISDGLSGYGLYLLARCRSKSTNKDQLKQYRDSLSLLTDQILQKLHQPNIDTSYTTQIWNGTAGVFIFLVRIASQSPQNSKIWSYVYLLRRRIFQSLVDTVHHWAHVEGWFTLIFFSTNDKELDQLIVTREFDTFLNWCHSNIKLLDFYEAGFYGLLLRLLGSRGLQRADEIADCVFQMIVSNYEKQGIKVLYTIDPDNRSIPIGLQRGVCGSAIPLLSNLKMDFSWLWILGIY